MLNQDQVQEIQEKIKYQRAIYNFHKSDDPELKKYLRSIIKTYEARHPQDNPHLNLMRSLTASASHEM